MKYTKTLEVNMAIMLNASLFLAVQRLIIATKPAGCRMLSMRMIGPVGLCLSI